MAYSILVSAQGPLVLGLGLRGLGPGLDNNDFSVLLSVFYLQVEMDGLTGKIKFDQRGQRTDFELDIIELKRDGLTRVRTRCFLPPQKT